MDVRLHHFYIKQDQIPLATLKEVMKITRILNMVRERSQKMTRTRAKVFWEENKQ